MEKRNENWIVDELKAELADWPERYEPEPTSKLTLKELRQKYGTKNGHPTIHWKDNSATKWPSEWVVAIQGLNDSNHNLYFIRYNAEMINDSGCHSEFGTLRGISYDFNSWKTERAALNCAKRMFF